MKILLIGGDDLSLVEEAINSFDTNLIQCDFIKTSMTFSAFVSRMSIVDEVASKIKMYQYVFLDGILGKELFLNNNNLGFIKCYQKYVYFLKSINQSIEASISLYSKQGSVRAPANLSSFCKLNFCSMIEPEDISINSEINMSYLKQQLKSIIFPGTLYDENDIPSTLNSSKDPFTNQLNNIPSTSNSSKDTSMNELKNILEKKSKNIIINNTNQ